MVFNFKIHGMPSPSVQVSQFSIKPSFSSFNFISRSRILPQFRASKPINRLHCLSLSSSSSPLSVHEHSSNEHSFEVSYLINTFGWPPEIAISKSKKLRFKTPQKPERVLGFLKRRGFTKTEISLVVEKHPYLLCCLLPRKTLLPKFEFLISLGLSTTEITGIITKAPRILGLGLEKIIHNFNLLCTLVNSYDEGVRIVKRDPKILLNIQELDTQVLVEAGVPAANILVFMSYRRTYQKQITTPYSFRKMVEQVKEMGFDPCMMKFLEALATKMVLCKSTWEDRVHVFKKYGWSDREILFAFEKRPDFIMSSKGKLEAVMDFVVNTMGIEATAVANYPDIFRMNLEKRTIPRCLFYLSLLEKGLYDKEFSMNILLISEAKFLTRFIKWYENEAPELRDLYNSLMNLHRLSLSSPSPSRSPVFVSENSSNEHSFEVSYLISTFGWPPELAFSKAKKLRFKTLEKPERMLAFLKNHGFTITQISLLVKKLPELLTVDPEKTLLPKFDFLSSLGLTRSEITAVVTKEPHILNRSLEKRIIPTFNLLRDLVNSDDEAVKMIISCPTILSQYHEPDNIQVLLNAGVPAKNIVTFMGYWRQLNISPSTPDKLRKNVEEVKEMGFDPCSLTFLYALRWIKLYSKSIWADKVQVLKKWGWSDHDIMLALEKDPTFIFTSNDKFERVMDFLVNKMRFEAADVSYCPAAFSMSLDKNIIPRCLVYKFLLEKGLWNGKLSLFTFALSKERFITRFIKPYEDEAPELWDIYNGKWSLNYTERT